MEFVAASLVIVTVGLMLAGTERKLVRLERRLRRMELQIDAMSDELGIETAEVDFRPVDLLLAQGKKVTAIKTYRDLTGASLSEAKDAVERRASPPHPGAPS